MPTILRGARLQLRPALLDDAPAILAILAQPAVATWWGRYDLERVRGELADDFLTFAIVSGGDLIGWLQCHEETDPEYCNVAFDISLTTELHGRGYGREALSLAIQHFIARGHHRFTIDPAAHNERAIRAYAAVGFKPVGVMRAYERVGDEPWHDNLLMDLLAEEFVSPSGAR